MTAVDTEDVIHVEDVIESAEYTHRSLISST